MITSIISIAISTAILWLAYRVLFINSNRLVFNRVFLIVALGFSLMLPVLGGFIGRNVPQVTSYRESILQGIMLEEVVITADGVVINHVSEMNDNEAVTSSEANNKAPRHPIGLMRLIWLIGLIITALVFLFKLAKIVFIIIRSPKKKMHGFTAVFTGKEHGPYSFFNYAFFTDENVSEEIVRHEMSHIEHHHSADIIFVELMMILQWFNPFIYLYKRELQSLHEYMADHDVVATGVDKKNYMMLILQQCTAADFSGMSNNFSLILTKKRIKMITQNKKAKGVIVKALLTLPVFALLLFANCKSNENNTPKEEKTVVTDTENITPIPIDNDETMPQNEDEILTGVVEIMPEFTGGTPALFDFISKNVKYPEAAKKNNQEGRVFIGFVVEKDGSVTDVSVLRGVCEELDNEALRVVKSMPKWTPGMNNGKAVRVQYTLPIVFKLSGDSTTTALSGTKWKGTGEGTKDGVKYVMTMTMDFYNDNDGLFVMKLTAQEKGKEAVVQFEDVGLDFTYSFDGKSAGSIQPKNPDGSDLGDEVMAPNGFVMKDGKIIVNFYDFKEGQGIENITFVKK